MRLTRLCIAISLAACGDDGGTRSDAAVDNMSISDTLGVDGAPASGSLDQTFGVGGFVRTAMPSTATAIVDLAIDSAGKLVAVGTAANDMLVVRYTAAGILDSAFSSDGVIVADSGAVEAARSLVLASGGEIYVGGTSTTGGTNVSA